jgi:hypothetical protein
MPAFLKLFHEIERDRHYSFYEASITLIPKLNEDTSKKRELQANLFNEHRCKKILNKIMAN